MLGEGKEGKSQREIQREMETFYSNFPLSGCHAREGGSSHSLEFESTHGRKTRGTHFTRTWMGQWTYRDRSHEVVLPHDP